MKTHLGHFVLAIAIVLASLIYALSHRYSLYIYKENRPIIFDHWTGKAQPETLF